MTAAPKLDITVVTTVWGDYYQYLPEWAASLGAQTLPPTQVIIVNAGSGSCGQALAELDNCRVPARVVAVPYRGMGDARNQAVAAAATQWVMHLDADDTLLPHALADVAMLAKDADVVSVGAVWGDRVYCFPDVTREKILEPRLGAFSCAAFRRSLWERRPYITANDSVEAPLWVGFAHLGGRFAGTTRPGFVYRTHPDSHSKRRSRQEQRAAAAQLAQLSREWSLGRDLQEVSR